MPEIHRHHLASELTDLLEIADVIDAVCDSLALHVPGRSIDDAPLRQALFALLDQPSQELWERMRDEWVVPNFLRGSSATEGSSYPRAAESEAFPNDPAVSFADACYAYGLPDQVCPSKRALRAILRWAISQVG